MQFQPESAHHCPSIVAHTLYMFFPFFCIFHSLMVTFLFGTLRSTPHLPKSSSMSSRLRLPDVHPSGLARCGGGWRGRGGLGEGRDDSTACLYERLWALLDQHQGQGSAVRAESKGADLRHAHLPGGGPNFFSFFLFSHSAASSVTHADIGIGFESSGKRGAILSLQTMRSLCQHLVSLVFVFGSLHVDWLTEGCSCALTHPQDAFCNSDIGMWTKSLRRYWKLRFSCAISKLLTFFFPSLTSIHT